MTFRRWKHWQSTLAVIAILTIGLMFLWPKAPQPPKKVTSVPQLETYITSLIQSGSPPGMSLIVLKNGVTVYSKGFGWADHPRNIKANPQTVYHWWSCTKIVTAIAVLQLKEQGKLRLSDSVTAFLPFFKVQYPSMTSRTITIQHLLTHSSGLPDAHFRIMSWVHHDGSPSLNQTAMVEDVLPEYSTLVFEPGDHAEYTNIGYMVLGAIIEKLTGETYEEYVRKNILEPLGMKHTDFLYTKAMEPDEAGGAHPLFDLWTPLIPFVAGSYVRDISNGHIWLKRVYNDQTPPSGLIGPASDAARLLSAYLNGGELDGHRILSRESISEMSRGGYLGVGGSGAQINPKQGIAWQVYADKGRFMIKHDGGGLGFSTVMQMYPDEQLALVLFANDATCESWRIVNLAAGLDW
jgi:D-alanyl-D-alanine carboxypeptidase